MTIKTGASFHQSPSCTILHKTFHRSSLSRPILSKTPRISLLCHSSTNQSHNAITVSRIPPTQNRLHIPQLPPPPLPQHDSRLVAAVRAGFGQLTPPPSPPVARLGTSGNRLGMGRVLHGRETPAATLAARRRRNAAHTGPRRFARVTGVT